MSDCGSVCVKGVMWMWTKVCLSHLAVKRDMLVGVSVWKKELGRSSV